MARNLPNMKLQNNKALDAEPPIASFLKSMLIGGGPVNAAVRPGEPPSLLRFGNRQLGSRGFQFLFLRLLCLFVAKSFFCLDPRQ